MKLSALNARIDALNERKSELERIRGMHWLKRPPEWRGSGKTGRLKEELDRIRGELVELHRIKRGNWYVDDIGAGGGPLGQPQSVAA